jgi:endonuclease-3
VEAVQNKRLHSKTLRIARELEKFLGIPVPPARKDHVLEMLIATLLSQNTNDWNSHRAYLELKKRYPRWEDVHRATKREIAALIRVGGMANQKSARIKKIHSRGRHGEPEERSDQEDPSHSEEQIWKT